MIKKTSILKIIQNDKQVDSLMQTEDFKKFLLSNTVEFNKNEIEEMNREQLIFATKQTINKWFAPQLQYQERIVKANL